jgi:hypothetical protein
MRDFLSCFNIIAQSLNYMSRDNSNRECGLELLVYITQITACSVHYISDRDFRKHPVRRNDRIQLCNGIKAV